MDLNFEQFLASEYSNLWIYEPKMKVYLRKARHAINRDLACHCLDVANVVVQKKYRGTGVFTQFLNRVEDEAEKRQWAVYVESILEPRLEPFFKKRGYCISPFSEPPIISMHRLPTNPINLIL